MTAQAFDSNAIIHASSLNEQGASRNKKLPCEVLTAACFHHEHDKCAGANYGGEFQSNIDFLNKMAELYYGSSIMTCPCVCHKEGSA